MQHPDLQRLALSGTLSRMAPSARWRRERFMHVLKALLWLGFGLAVAVALLVA